MIMFAIVVPRITLVMAAEQPETDIGVQLARLQAAAAAEARLDIDSLGCDALRFEFAKSIRAEGFAGLNLTDPTTSKWQLAQALHWAGKENKLLNRVTQNR